MEEEESQGWFSWMWNWGGEADTQTKESKSGGKKKMHKIEQKKHEDTIFWRWTKQISAVYFFVEVEFG